MYKYKRVKIDDSYIGSQLAEDIFTENNILLAVKGVTIDKDMVTRLNNISTYDGRIRIRCEVEDSSLESSVIQEPDDKDIIEDSYNEAGKPAVPLTDDMVSLELADEVKPRVVKSLKYIYSNNDPDDIAEVSEVVSNIIVKTIMSDSVSAYCLGELNLCDEEVYNHCVDVASIASIIGRSLNWSERNIEHLCMAGILHDIGKRDVDDAILYKNGPLTDLEYMEMKKHSRYGFKRMKNAAIPDEVRLAILQHHERNDGTGYPLGLEADEISTYSKIIAISDVYAALVSKRPYKDPIRPPECIEMMYGMTEQFDPVFLRNFINSIIVFPNHSTVSLSDGRKAYVISQNRGFPLRPNIIVDKKRVNLSRSDASMYTIL